MARPSQYDAATQERAVRMFFERLEVLGTRSLKCRGDHREASR